MKKQQETSIKKQTRKIPKKTQSKSFDKQKVKARKKRPRSRIAKKSQQERKLKKRKTVQKKQLFLELSLSGGIVLTIFCIVFFSLFEIQTNEGYGMTPNFEPGEKVLIQKNETIRRFSLVAFQVPNRKTNSIRRVIGLPGETVSYRDEVLWVDGQEITERFLLGELQEARKDGYRLTPDFTLEDIPNLKGTTVPKGYYLVLGDNRAFSIDSREFGLVPADNINGVVKAVIFPVHKIRSF